MVNAAQCGSALHKVYNALGQLALLTTPGAKPGLDETKVVFGEAFAVIVAILAFAALTKGSCGGCIAMYRNVNQNVKERHRSYLLNVICIGGKTNHARLVDSM